MNVTPELSQGGPHYLLVGEAPGELTIDGKPAGFTEPPPAYEDDWGNMWYFFEDGTVWVQDPEGGWHSGTYWKRPG
jgi:hypothetical protein